MFAILANVDLNLIGVHEINPFPPPPPPWFPPKPSSILNQASPAWDPAAGAALDRLLYCLLYCLLDCVFTIGGGTRVVGGGGRGFV